MPPASADAIKEATMTLPNDPETARRYPEAYEWNVKREQEGKRRMKMATRWGLTVGIISWLLVSFGLAAATQKAVALFAGAVLGVPIGFLLGVALYRLYYDSGLNMVLRAQQMLVAIDTEHNTREIAEALRRSQTVKS